MYYVYAYWDPIRLEYFYAGKGKNQRAYTHLNRKDRHPVTNRIINIRRAGYEPEIKFIAKNLDEELAFLAETEFILKYGRRNIKTGCLLNLTNGGEGMSGYVLSDTHRKAISKSNSIKNKTQDNSKFIGWNTGKKLSDEHKKAISTGGKGIKKHPGFSEKLRQARLNESVETRAKRVAAQRAAWKKKKEKKTEGLT